MNKPPPIPELCESTTPNVTAAAIAPSTAFPPPFIAANAASVAAGCTVAAKAARVPVSVWLCAIRQNVKRRATIKRMLVCPLRFGRLEEAVDLRGRVGGAETVVDIHNGDAAAARV